MPRFNRKGPKGEAMSGRGRGGCNPSGRGRDDLESQVEAGADAPNQSRHRRREIYRVEGDGSNASFQPGNGKGIHQPAAPQRPVSAANRGLPPVGLICAERPSTSSSGC